MRELIQSLSRKQAVSILFTSHNLAEVETLCARVAVISRGRIRGVDSPANLRMLTQNTERVRITLRNLSQAELKTTLSNQVSDFQVEETKERISVLFTRQPEDDSLDATLKALHKMNAIVLDIETQRATLLDLLTRYETEDE
jgi:ABC-2 type transport system ATP-binding protein